MPHAHILPTPETSFFEVAIELWLKALQVRSGPQIHHGLHMTPARLCLGSRSNDASKSFQQWGHAFQVPWAFYGELIVKHTPTDRWYLETNSPTEHSQSFICPAPSKGQGNKGNMEPPPTLMNDSTCLRLGESHVLQINLCPTEEEIQTAHARVLCVLSAWCSTFSIREDMIRSTDSCPAYLKSQSWLL